jgi:hypothetical protein
MGRINVPGLLGVMSRMPQEVRANTNSTFKELFGIVARFGPYLCIKNFFMVASIRTRFLS